MSRAVRPLYTLAILAVLLASIAFLPFSSARGQAVDADESLTASNPQLPLVHDPDTDLEGGLDGYQQPVGDPTVMVDKTYTQLDELGRNLHARLRDAPSILDEILAAMKEKSPDGQARYFIYLIVMTLLALAFGFVATTLLFGGGLLKNWFMSKQRLNPQGFLEKLPILALRGGLGLVSVLISTAVGIGVLRLFWGPFTTPQTQKTVIIVAGVYAFTRVIGLIWWVVLAPYLANYRIPHFSDRNARILFHWLWITGAYALCVLAFVTWLVILGVPQNIIVVTVPLLSLVNVFLNIALVMANYRAVGSAILGGKPREEATWPARLAASTWGVLIIAYVVVAYGYALSRDIMMLPPGPPLIVSAYVVLTSIIVVYGISMYMIEWLFLARRRELPPEIDAQEAGNLTRVSAEEEPSTLRPPARMRTFKDLASRVASIFAVLAGVYAVFQIWGANTMINENPIVEHGLHILRTLLMAYIAYHALRIWIDQKIEDEGGQEVSAEPGEGEGGSMGASRLATLLPLFRNFLLAIVTISVLVFIALELGVNVAPLFAGAGIVGLALGFGAQTLVRDVLSGAFFLIDDAFRRGEYIDIGSVKGIVEKISIRSFQLRHHLGYLHTVPFGEIQHLTNYSRDWVIMKLPLRLTYDTDIEAVRKMIKKLGVALLDDPVHGEKFLQPLKSQGVIQMEDSAMIVRVKFMTRPGDQWVIRKVVYAKIRALFEREGVKFAHREVTVRIADGKGSDDLSDDQKKAMGAAARRLEEQHAKANDFLDDGPGGDG
jgi:small-conductance mechanosensitive channel